MQNWENICHIRRIIKYSSRQHEKVNGICKMEKEDYTRKKGYFEHNLYDC